MDFLGSSWNNRICLNLLIGLQAVEAERKNQLKKREKLTNKSKIIKKQNGGKAISSLTHPIHTKSSQALKLR